MSLPTSEQIASAQKATLDLLFGLAGQMTDGVGKLIALNMKAGRLLLTEMQDNVLKALSAKEFSEAVAPQATPAASIPEQVLSYNREVFEIMSGVQVEFARLTQAQYEAYGRRAQTLVDDVAKSAPAGSEAAIAAWKSAMEATNTLVGTVQKSYQQAAQFVESSIAAASSAASTTTRRAAEKASAAAKR